MIRNLKVLGLAVVAMLAMTAVLVPVAQADEPVTEHFTAVDETYPESFTGTNGVGSETFTTEAGTVECASKFTGSAAGETTTITVTPEYENCKAFGFLNATVSHEGCHYLFHLTTKLAGPVWQAHVDVTCPEGKSIKIVAGTCEATVGAQPGLTTVNLRNNGATTDVEVEANVSGIAYTVTKDGFGCPFSGTGPKTGAKYVSDSPTTVTSTNGIHIG